MGGPPTTGQYDRAALRYTAPMDRDRSATPNAIPWPPLIYAGGAGLALLLDRAAPLPPWWIGAHWPAMRALGDALLLAGIALDLWAMFTMWRHKANILPHRAATALVTHGPFAWSRNPIYLGNTMLLVGAGLAFAIPWFIPIALIAATLTAHFAIAREEAHLNARFGRAWREYRLRVRRWVGR
jgi:protein-S-isoprenylcysteine O-methyltransferase Ste14